MLLPSKCFAGVSEFCEIKQSCQFVTRIAGSRSMYLVKERRVAIVLPLGFRLGLAQGIGLAQAAEIG